MDQKITSPNISELKLILLLVLAQFLDILDFMMVMPLGPDYAKGLSINLSELGFTAVAYTISAAITGFLSSIYIDRFERKKVLLLAISGIVVADIIAGFSTNYATFLFSRFLSGIFGGPSTAVAFAIIADLVAPEKRGYVIGKVMSAFSLAASLGVPICLQISLNYGWQNSFFAVALIGVIVIIVNLLFLPKINIHLRDQESIVSYKSLLNNETNLMAITFSSLGMLASFMIIPYISAYLQYNLDFPRSGIGPLYFIGGIASFITVQIIGKFVDKYSSVRIAFIANFFFAVTLFFGFTFYLPFIPIPVIYVPFMIAMSMRIIANSTLISKVPKPHERAGFMSIISMSQHIASALGSLIASLMLVQINPVSPLQNMGLVAMTALAIFISLPFLMARVEKKL